MLREDVKPRTGNALKIARAVFDESKSLTVRSEILLYMALGAETKEEHKAFIYHTLSRFSEEPRILRSCLRTLRSLYVNDQDAFNLMVRFINHSDEMVSQEAAAGVLYSSQFKSASESVRDALVSAGSSLTRRAYLARIAAAEFKQLDEILLDDVVSNYVDFAEPISNSKLKRMAKKSLQNPKLRGISRKRTIAALVDRDAQPRFDDDYPEKRAAMIRALLEAIGRKYRIPFRLDHDPI